METMGTTVAASRTLALVAGFADLIVWQEAARLAAAVLRTSESLRGPGALSPADQMRRAADSVPANIAEGYGRGVGNDCLRFLRMARSSLGELESHIRAAVLSGRLTGAEAEPIIDHVIRVRFLLVRFASSVARRSRPSLPSRSSPPSPPSPSSRFRTSLNSVPRVSYKAVPLRSMTGFGAAEGAVAGGRLRIEIRTVNHRHLSVQLKAPGELAALEADIRERLRAHFERGHATISARWTVEPSQAAAAEVDVERAKAVVEALRRVARELGIGGDVDLATLARLPDVVRVRPAETAAGAGEVLAVLDEAAQAALRMREREGGRLGEDLRGRCRRLGELAGVVAARAPTRIVAERDRLAKAVAELSGGVALDGARLAQEIALLADKLDITEELVRFRTHVAAVEGALANGAAVGKQLGFLLQELSREANTMGAKANDAPIVEAVLAMKGELERMREQVENLE